MKFHVHGHRFGERVVPKDLLKEVTDTIEAVRITPARGKSEEIKNAILSGLRAKGWSEEVSLSVHSRITYTSKKGDIGLCFQTGNMGRMYADLIKLQAVYLRENIKAGILLLPTQICAKMLGDNVANYERLLGEMEIFERVISMPLTIIGLE